MNLGKTLASSTLLAALICSACGEEEKHYDREFGSSDEHRAARAVVDAISSVGKLAEEPGRAVDQFDAAQRDIELLSSAKYTAMGGEPIPDDSGSTLDADLPTTNPGPSSPADLGGPCVLRSRRHGTLKYKNCKLSFFTFDGELTVSSSRASMDVHLALLSTRTQRKLVTWDKRADVRLAPEYLVGTVANRATDELGGSRLTHSSEASYEIQLTGGCPTGGEMEIHSVTRGHTPTRRVDVDVWVQAKFGPNCGDVTLR